jgi:protein-L-isoaspartate O-methyltransferase
VGAQVPREPFVPDTIWVDIGTAHSPPGFTALSRHDHPRRWRELVEADEPVITQVDEGRTAVGNTGWSPSSSGSKPSVVADMLDALDLRPGHSLSLDEDTDAIYRDCVIVSLVFSG